jgi:EF hand
MKKLAVLTILTVALAAPAMAQESGRPQIDTDGDGKVSKTEFLAMAETRFAKMDKNGDGFITKEERPDRSKMREHMKGKREGGGDGVPGMMME